MLTLLLKYSIVEGSDNENFMESGEIWDKKVFLSSCPMLKVILNMSNLPWLSWNIYNDSDVECIGVSHQFVFRHLEPRAIYILVLWTCTKAVHQSSCTRR